MSEEATLDEFADSSDTEGSQERVTSQFWDEIPESWRLVNGSEVYDVNPNPKPEEEPNTYIEMDALDTELPWPKYFGMRDASEYSGKTFTEGDTLFARITPCTENGKAALVPEMETEIGIGSTEYAVLSPKKNRINPWLLYYIGKSYPVHNYAVSRMRGSTGRQRVPFSVFRRELDIALPPLPEQRKIVTILYTIDRAIEKTGQIIEQKKRVRKGMMQDFFSEGYYNHDSYETSRVGPVEWKQPATWTVKKLGEMTSGIIEIDHNMPDKTEEGVPFIAAGDITQRLKIDLEGTEKISKEDYERLSKKFDAERGDILYTRFGTYIGVARKIDFDPEVIASYSVVLIKADKVNSDYLTSFLNSPISRKEAENRTRGSANRNLNLSEIKQMSVPVPTEGEQRKIADALTQVENSIKSEEAYKSNLSRIKHGLMQDLLSGTVRTTDTNIEVPDEIAQHG